MTSRKDGSLDGHATGCTTGQDPAAAKASLRDADRHARETVRLWAAGEQTNSWPEQDANLAAAYLRVRAKLAEYDKYIGEFTNRA